MTFQKIISDPNSWFSITAAALAIIALYQSHMQLAISNRQTLFDRRLSKYMLIKGLLSLYSENQKHINNNPDIYRLIDFNFSLLTNNSFLESVCMVMEEPLEYSAKKIFLTKIESLEEAAIEIEFIWEKSNVEIFSQFIREYSKLLTAMHRQQIKLKNLDERNKQKTMQLEDYEKQAKESAKQFGLISAIENLDRTYEEIKNSHAEARLIKEIRLVK